MVNPLSLISMYASNKMPNNARMSQYLIVLLFGCHPFSAAQVIHESDEYNRWSTTKTVSTIQYSDEAALFDSFLERNKYPNFRATKAPYCNLTSAVCQKSESRLKRNQITPVTGDLAKPNCQGIPRQTSDKPGENRN